MKYLLILFSMLFILGCKGSDGDDGTASVIITADTTFKSSTFALGCFVVTSSNTTCLCYESNTGYTGTASGSGTCKDFASSVNLVADQTVLSAVAAGGHNWCIAKTSAVAQNCMTAGVTGTVTVTISSGESGSNEFVVLPKNGDNGVATAFTLTYGSTSAAFAAN